MATPNLWNSAACADWDAALARYPAVVAAQGVNGLVDLDRWYREELTGLLAARRPGFVTPEELDRVLSWKMKRGAWRERNRRLVRGNDPAAVDAAGRAALAAVPDPRRPIAALATLAGVGPATASAVLAAVRPDVYPFFDELIAQQIPDLGPVAFTAAYYQRYAARLRERTARLLQDCPAGGWTAHAAGQALWAASGGKAGVP